MGDTLTVLRDGTLVDTVPVSEVTEDKNGGNDGGTRDFQLLF